MTTFHVLYIAAAITLLVAVLVALFPGNGPDPWRLR